MLLEREYLLAILPGLTSIFFGLHVSVLCGGEMALKDRSVLPSFHYYAAAFRVYLEGDLITATLLSTAMQLSEKWTSHFIGQDLSP